MSYFGVSTRNGVGLGLGTVPSLTNTPLGYRLAPSLDLSFAGSDALSPAITFNRTTNATLTNSAGLIANAPMNLLTFSEQFDNAAWTKTNATITANSVAAPNGTTTADTATATAANGVVQNTPMAITVVVDTTYTSSVYIKRRTGTGSVQLSRLDGTYVTLSVTDEWQRFTVTSTAANTTGRFFIRLVTSGDAVDIWGAQLEVGSTATTYNPTTVKNLLGFTENFDNAAWTKSNAFVQTNLAVNSVFANTGGAAPTSYTQSFATGTSAPSGTASNGDVIYTQTATAQRPLISQAITTVVGVVYTSSMTITEASGLTVADVIGASGVVSTYTLNGASVLGTVLASPGVVTATWTAAATTSGARFGIGVIGNATGSISFHGAQVVQGTSAGDYKATYAAAAAVGYTDIYGQPFAQKLVENTATAEHRVQANITFSAAPFTASGYFKAAERSFAFIRLDDSGSAKYAYFNLATGTVGTITSGLTAFIESIGDGWYRCAARFNTPAAGSGTVIFASTTANGTVTYTGDGTSGIYIFGAQLSDSASVDPYVYQPVAAPTSTAYYGPRFDYDPVTLAPKGLLIEEQRTNLLTYSQDFSNAAWGKFDVLLTPNAIVAPSGTLAASLITDTSTPAVEHYFENTITTFTNQTYTSSIYVKAATASNFQMAVVAIGSSNTVSHIQFNQSSGVYVPAFQTNGLITSATATAVGNGWYRCSVVYTLNGTVTYHAQRMYPFNLGTYAGTTVGHYFWGAQLEAGSFATSYIPTVASQVTRAADSASMIGNNFARWYNVNEGTFYAQASSFGDAGVRYITFASDATNNNRIIQYFSPTQTIGLVTAGGTLQAQLVRNGITEAKTALAYATDNFAFARNSSVTTDTSGTVPVGLVQMQIGAGLTAATTPLNGTISRIAYYNRRLSNTELQGLTS